MRSINREFYRFVFWGGINTLAGYLIYALLLQFLPYLVAYSIAYVAGILMSYLLNTKLVFKEELKLSTAAKYPLVYLAQYLLGTITMYVQVQTFKVNKFLAPALVVLVTIPVTYSLSRLILKSNSGHTEDRSMPKS